MAATVKKSGGEVRQIVEQAPLSALLRFGSSLWRWPEKLRQLATIAPRRYLSGSQVIRAHGETQLEAITLRDARGVERTIACQRLAIGYGLVPNIETALHFGCTIADEAIAVNRWQQTSVANIYAAGECTGFGGSELALAEGEIAGFAAADARGLRPGPLCPSRALADICSGGQPHIHPGREPEKRLHAG